MRSQQPVLGWPTATLECLLTTKTLKAFFLITILFLGGTFLPGCGAIESAVLAVVCTPCALIGVVVAAVVGVIVVSEVFRECDGCDPGPCVDCPPPPIPPVIPPPLLALFFGIRNADGSQCPVDRITIENPADANDRPAGVFDAYAPPQPGDTPGVRRMDIKRMSWPENSNPTFPDGSRLLGSHLVNQLAWVDRDGDGHGDAFITTSSALHIVVHFNNGATLDISEWFGAHPIVHRGTTFVVSWDPVRGAEVLGVYQQTTTSTVTMKNEFNESYIFECDPVHEEVRLVDIVL